LEFLDKRIFEGGLNMKRRGGTVSGFEEIIANIGFELLDWF